MLSEETLSIVKSTVPVLSANREILAQYFYDRMFAHNPEVLSLFNFSHQRSGSQQRALAGAICAYAAHIDCLDILHDRLDLIAQKHASLRIKPEHYPIVGRHLLASIKKILGSGVAKEIIVAWEEAYKFLVDILIRREEEIYLQQERMVGGWRDFKYFEVIKKEKESDVITSFYLQAEDRCCLPYFKPGQYITIRVPGFFDHSVMRHYSLSDLPGQDYFRISVKREGSPNPGISEGYVSNLLHKHIGVGDRIEVAPPCGEFFLHPNSDLDCPLVLLAGGVGITPILSILLSALKQTPSRQIILIYASLNEQIQAFGEMICELACTHSNLRVHYRYSCPAPIGINRILSDDVSEGFIDADLIEGMVGRCAADYYFCGPKVFITTIYDYLLGRGVCKSRIYFEFFGPREEMDLPLNINAA